MSSRKAVSISRSRMGKRLTRLKAEELTKAAEKGQVNKIRQLLSQGLDIDVPNSKSLTALMAAVIAGQEQSAVFLIKCGACVNAIVDNPLAGDAYGWTPLKFAAEKGHIALLKILIKAGADVNHERSGFTALGQAAKYGHLAALRLLIRAGAKIQSNALYGPVAGGHLDIVRHLIKCGADVNYKNAIGEPLLMTAVVRGHQEMVELLLRHGANVNATQAGQTSLMRAIHKGFTDIALLLMESGADIHMKDFGKRTALWFAAKLGNATLVKALTEKGADPKVADVNGDSPIGMAKRERHKEVWEFLSRIA